MGKRLPAGVIRKAVLASFTVLLLGCMSLGGTFLGEDEKNIVFIGTRADLRGLNPDSHAFPGAPLLLIDLPFSLLADTVLLPYTIPKTLSNLSADGKDAGPESAPAAPAGDENGDPEDVSHEEQRPD